PSGNCASSSIPPLTPRPDAICIYPPLMIRQHIHSVGSWRTLAPGFGLRLRRTAFLGGQGFGKGLWVLSCHPQKRQGRTVGSPAPLLPVLQRRHTDTNHQRKF